MTRYRETKMARSRRELAMETETMKVPCGCNADMGSHGSMRNISILYISPFDLPTRMNRKWNIRLY